MLMHQGINGILRRLQDECGETTQLSIRAGKDTQDYLVQPTLVNPAVTVETGQKRYVESVGGHRFFVSSPSFFQVNVEQAEKAVEVVRLGLDLGPEDVLVDAYTGVGAFAVLLAGSVKKVVAVEESSAAVADARQNTAGLDNVELMLGRTEDVIHSLPTRPDAVVLDPPRTGCQPGALAGLIELAVPRVAYVSCDAETLSRDLKILCEGGYSLLEVVPIDMFPQTHHVECVALLRWVGSETGPLVLASASPRRREIMSSLGLEFEIIPANVNEDALPGESPEAMVERLSQDKALAVAAAMSRGFVIGADSTVVHQGQAVGKPVDDDDARAMLRRLRGTTHHVCTGITVADAATGSFLTGHMTAEITLRHISDEEIEESIASGTPRDKAGAYAVQDRALRPASAWEGCYSNIVGLPTCRLLEMLDELGYPWPLGWAAPDAAVCKPGCRITAAKTGPAETAP
jgi:23S rRNA (uracil1939-C5)-methyltransferase